MFPPRREFPNPVKRAAYVRSQGICECHRLINIPGLVPGGCNQKLGIGNTFYEHVNPDGNGGSPTLENCAVLVRTCWRIKTDSYDRPVVAKTNRMGDMAIGIKTGAASNADPLPGTLASGWKHKMRGGWEKRV